MIDLKSVTLADRAAEMSGFEFRELMQTVLENTYHTYLEHCLNPVVRERLRQEPRTTFINGPGEPFLFELELVFDLSNPHLEWHKDKEEKNPEVYWEHHLKHGLSDAHNSLKEEHKRRRTIKNAT